MGFSLYQQWNLIKEGYFFGGCFFVFCVFVFQAGFVAFVASVAFVGVWLLWVYHALPI
jgi:VIT1/CCC1 family predicted Fe2+/Mn2+ transporter